MIYDQVFTGNFWKAGELAIKAARSNQLVAVVMSGESEELLSSSRERMEYSLAHWGVDLFVGEIESLNDSRAAVWSRSRTRDGIMRSMKPTRCS